MAALAGLVAQLPLAWFAPSQLAPQGTLWRGQLTPMPAIGPFDLKLGAGNWLKGLPPLHIRQKMPGLDFSAYAGPSKIAALYYQGQLSALPVTDARFGPMQGQIKIAIESMRYHQDQGCLEATGTVWTDVLMRNQALLQWQGPELSGPILCEQGHWVAVLRGQQSGDDIEARLTVRLDGSYQSEITARSADSRADMALTFLGFNRQGERYRLTEQGRWR